MSLPSQPQPATSAARRTELIRRLGSSTFNYWFGYVANLGLVAWLISHAVVDGQLVLSPLATALCAIGGLLSWTLTEYLLHRYVYHELPSFLAEGHLLHHRAPKDNIGVPWYLTTVALVLVFFGVTFVASPATTGLFMGMHWLGYIIYCLAHHGSHRWKYPGGWLRKMQRHHHIHHAHPEYNWGVTTAFWDLVFRTHYDSRRQASAGRASSIS